MRHPRRVVYVIVDGMSPVAFEQAVASGRAPAFAFLKQHATYVRDAVSVFPSITPAATAALLTGATPAEHGIPGMCWYDREAQRFVNYGQSPRAALVEGVQQVLRDVLVNLNARHLSPSVQTLHETLDERGIPTASVNFMVWRGNYERVPELPTKLLRLLFDDAVEPIRGPRAHYLADVLHGEADACRELLSVRALRKRLKVTDAYAACVTRDLVERGEARLIVFYLHENDHHSHVHGPSAQVESLVEASGHVGLVLDAFPSWEQALSEVGFVVTADHAQSPVSEDGERIFALEDVLDELRLLRPANGREPFGDNDAACAGNGRVGFVYLHERRRKRLLGPAVRRLLRAPGVDQVAWRDGDWFRVATAEASLRFRAARAGGVRDELGRRWQLDGDVAAVGGALREGRLETPEYPLALTRLAGCLPLERAGDLVVTPKLTWELSDLAGGDHRGGGDHASLHAQDSVVPFLSTLPDAPRLTTTTDVAPHVAAYLTERAGAPPRRRARPSPAVRPRTRP